MTTRHSRQGGPVLLCLLTAVLLAGCGGGGGDQADPTPSFSPQPTAASSSSFPVSTSSSASPVQETPEAFVRRWNALSTEMQNTGDTVEFRAISASCDACTKVADLVDKYYAAGGSIAAEGWKFLKLSCKTSSAVTSECVGMMSNGLTKVIKGQGQPQTQLPGGRFTEVFDLRLIDQTWNMSFIAQRAT